MKLYLQFLVDCLKARRPSQVDAYLTLVGVLMAFILWQKPKWLDSEYSNFISATQGWLPWVALVSLEAVYRLIMSPYWLHRQTTERIADLAARNRSLAEGYKSKLAIECSAGLSGCKKPCGHAGHGRVFRFQVTNLGVEPVRECIATLDRIEFAGVPIWHGDHIKLTFQPSEDLDSECKTITSGPSYYVDVVFIEQGSGKPWKFSPGTKNHIWRSTPSFDDLFQQGQGDYIFVITLAAPGMKSITRHFLLRWTADLTTASITLVE